MLVSYTWLKELVPVTDPPQAFAERLDLTGTAVESIITSADVPEGIIVGLIQKKEKHPDADTLWVTTVDIGKPEPLQIVCGAQNFEAGDKVPVATVGTTMPNGMRIKKAKLRGIVSKGMNCSAAELGISSDGAGLMILPEDAPVGVPFADYYDAGDTVFDLEITPNRGDCLSMVGIAREVGAVYDLPVSRTPRTQSESGERTDSLVEVTIDDPALCPRYTARVIKGAKVGPSPQWIVDRLEASGIRSVNNIVDATNYILVELGQPLHAFDLGKLAQNAAGKTQVIVRAAADGERITTLDGEDRSLDSDMVVIADVSGPVALAGVMGGLATEVTDDTRDILLESATFSPQHTSRTSRKLDLISEASLRYERGVDANQAADCAAEAAALIVELAGGEVLGGVVDSYPKPQDPWTVGLSTCALQALVGAPIPEGEARRILKLLGCSVTGEGELEVLVPTFRPDLTREADLIEEVLRVWGMDKVDLTLPASSEKAGGLSQDQKTRDRIGQLLRGLGLNETMTYAFDSEEELIRLGFEVDRETQMRLLNPMSGEQDVLRKSIVLSLLKSVTYNQSRGIKDVHLYEIGATFFGRKGKKLPKEKLMLAGVLAGSWSEQSWNQQSEELGFFDGKGVLESMFDKLGVADVSYRPVEGNPYLQPGRAAEVLIKKTPIGILGEVHPKLLEALEIRGTVCVFELSLKPILTAARDLRPVVMPSRFPAVELDAAFVVDLDVPATNIMDAIRSGKEELLDSVRLFDVYESDSIGEGKRSLAFSLAYRAPDRTLTSEEVEPLHERIVKRVCDTVGATLRDR